MTALTPSEVEAVAALPAPRNFALPDREITARAIYERYPYYMAESSGVMQHSMTVSTKFDWDAAPAFHQQDCYDLADAIIRAHLKDHPNG